MKHSTIILLLLLTCGIGFSQTIVPANYLKKPLKEIDSIKSRAYLYDSSIIPSNHAFLFLPSISNIEYFEKASTQFLQNNVISYNDSLSNITMYSELAADFIGPVRVSAGITLAYPKSDTNTVEQKKINREKFIQRFTTGGGAVVFNFALPIFSYDSPIFGTAMSFTPRFSIDPPSFGVTNGSFAHNTAIGTDLQAELRGIKGIFRFFGNTRLSYVAGNSTFYNALELKEGSRKGFWLNNYNIGVNIKDVFTISYTKYWGSDNIKDKLSGYLSFTVSPNF
ncbi:hypothetical protein [Chitinophaga silvisoli]|uniref:Uncharacterized protein n=1 Tax=Chitinophaga silvisoli TaxID=2291814 RepID=A0A3E1P2X4_9BACT|nr:hypothetical protein [Chitinophaga silvisoli]RFM34464.1 hypothetical protein DXN04_14400 [Chitinophaga silvisoli]